MKEFFKAIIRGIIKGAMYLYYKVVYRFKVVGKGNIPKKGPIIICANHKSFLDPPLLEITCGRYARFLAKEELTKNKFLAFLGFVFDAILVKKDSKEVKALKESLQTLKKEQCLVLFPEGTRNGLAKGEKVKDGAAFFALRTKTSVVPAGISGGEKPFRKMRVAYGEPIDLVNFYEMYQDKDMEKDALEGATKVIMDAILELTK